MLKIRVIPILLIKEGILVKSINFSNYRTLGIPIPTVRVYNMRRLDELIVLDLDKTISIVKPNFMLMADIARECGMPLTVGGGVRKIEHVKRLLRSGADKISINTRAVEYPNFISEVANIFGNQCIVVAIDVVKKQGEYRVVVNGGRQQTELDPALWAKQVMELGAGEILLTSVEKEGEMKGYDQNLIKLVSNAVSIPVIANGGAGRPSDFEIALKSGAAAVAASSIFHFTHITPGMVRSYLAEKGFPTRSV